MAVEIHKEGADRIFVAMVAEILLVCAVFLAFFVQFEMPLTIATAGAIFVLLVGSLLCWKGKIYSIAVLVLSLLAVQIMLISHFPILLLPFAAADVLALMLATVGKSHSETTAL